MTIEINLVTKGMVKDMNRLQRNQPKIFNAIVQQTLLYGATMITVMSAVEGSKVAKFTGKYSASWRHTRVLGTANKQWIKVYNLVGYAMVIEHGVKVWKHHPPIDPLALWGRMKLGLGEKESKSFAYALAQAMMGKGKSGTAKSARTKQKAKKTKTVKFKTGKKTAGGKRKKVGAKERTGESPLKRVTGAGASGMGMARRPFLVATKTTQRQVPNIRRVFRNGMKQAIKTLIKLGHKV